MDTNNFTPTVTSIKELISDGKLPKDYLEDNWRDNFSEYNGWKFQNEERFGGCEGSGEEHWIVFKAEKYGELTKYFMVPGWYQSYHGGELEWGNLHEVEPFEKTVRDWRFVK